MPIISAYIRKEDLPKWKALENKSEWLHEQLRSVRTRTKLSPEAVAAYEKMSGFKTTDDVTVITSSDKEFELVEKIYEPVKPFVPKPPDPETGYPCCLGANRCKHWEYEGLSSAWVNTLTGKTREVT